MLCRFNPIRLFDTFPNFRTPIKMRCLGNPLGRRGFMTVGALGGLGLTMGDLFRSRQAMADQKKYDFMER